MKTVAGTVGVEDHDLGTLLSFLPSLTGENLVGLPALDGPQILADLLPVGEHRWAEVTSRSSVSCKWKTQ